MTTPGPQGSSDSVPPKLRDTHLELEQIQIEERGSFGVELRAELAQEWKRVSETPPQGRRPRLRFVGSAAAAILVIGTLAVPPARASLVRLIWPAPEPVVEAQPEVDPGPVPPTPRPATAAPATTPAHSKPSPVPEPDLTGLPEWPAPLPTTFPVLLDRERARQIVADEYPDSLQRANVGGKVQVLLWVRPDGGPDYTQIGRSSGLPELDMAALRATRALHFLPATRAGTAVGTWVEFAIEFRPSSDEDQPGPEDHGIQIPLSN